MVEPPSGELTVSVAFGGFCRHSACWIGSTNPTHAAVGSSVTTFVPVTGLEREDVKLTDRFHPCDALIAYGYRDPTEPAVAGSALIPCPSLVVIALPVRLAPTGVVSRGVPPKMRCSVLN